MSKFRLSKLQQPTRSVDFDKQKVTLGRLPTNDFVVEDSAVSRYQAHIEWRPEGFYFKNIGRFPVRINKEALEANKTRLLASGDILTIGRLYFRFSTISEKESSTGPDSESSTGPGSESSTAPKNKPSTFSKNKPSTEATVEATQEIQATQFNQLIQPPNQNQTAESARAVLPGEGVESTQIVEPTAVIDPTLALDPDQQLKTTKPTQSLRDLSEETQNPVLLPEFKVPPESIPTEDQAAGEPASISPDNALDILPDGVLNQDETLPLSDSNAPEPLERTVVFERAWTKSNTKDKLPKQRPTNSMQAVDKEAVSSAGKSEDKDDETLVDSVPAVLVEVKGPSPGTSHSLEKSPFVVGRSPESDIVISDQRISRRHFSIEKRASEYYLVRLTRHQTVLVNNQPVDECRLYHNDQIDFFTLSFAFKSINPADQKTASIKYSGSSQPWLDETSQPDATFLQSKIVARKPGPRLINHNKTGGSTVYHLNAGRTCIGRDINCDVVIQGDKSISRMHAVIEKQLNGHFVTPESMNPLLLNGKRIKAITRLYTGDTLQLGETLLTFLSEFKEDGSPAKKWTSGVLLPLTSVLSLALVGMLLFNYAWKPYHFSSSIEMAETHIANAEYSESQALLQALYKKYPDNDQQQQITKLLASTVIDQVDVDIRNRELQASKDFLLSFLRQFGTADNLEAVWSKLNEVRFLLARQHETNNEIKAALKEYVAVDNDSDYYNSAQKAISDIWLQSQQEESEELASEKADINDLLVEAGELFDKKHYLTPLNNNAFAIYAQILAVEPSNKTALKKIEQMKTFYRIRGNEACLRGDQVLAETFRRRFLIIDPENKSMQQALNRVDQCVVSTMVAANQNDSQPALTTASQQPQVEAAVADAKLVAENSQNRQKVEKILQKEGIESEWIIEYLFDEPENASEPADSDKPW